MRKLLIITFLFISPVVNATDYYVKNSGNNSNSGLSDSQAWATLVKVNSAFSIMKPGDRILFNRGDTFYGTLIISKSGVAGSPIIIGAYGAGNKPIITGFTTITGWINEGNGIYSKTITCESAPNMVTINGLQYGMGKWPNTGYRTYESFVTNVSIKDNGLGDIIDWAGAEVVIRKNDWSLDRCLITDHSGEILTFTNLGTTQNSSANYGYFIQNDLRTLDVFGEWYYNTKSSTFYMYFGANNSNDYAVKVSTIDKLINDNGYDYLTIDNISFEGSNKSALFFTGYYADNTTIQNCNINLSGNDGIYLEGCRNTSVNNNYIDHSSRAGIYVQLGGNNNILNNTIKNSGLIGGIANSGTECDGIFFIQSTIESVPQGSLIQYNNIDSSGDNGIYFTGNNVEVRNNFINNSVLSLDDAGGIYTANVAYTGRIIDGNIILNSFGNNDGTSNSKSLAEGIYLDEYSAKIKVTNNTIAQCSDAGMKFHKAHDNIIENNTSFNNYAGIDFENWTGTSIISGNTMTGNIFFAKASAQYALAFSSVPNEFSSFGIAANNYYTRPLKDDDVFYTYQPTTGAKNRTLTGWQALTNQDLNSHKSPITITNINDIRFEYNATKSDKLITLDKPMIDVKGTKYQISITLLPYTSAVLMVDPDPAQPVVPVYKSSIIENATPSLVEMIYSIGLANTVPGTSAFNVQVNGVNRTVNSITISGDKVILTLAINVVFGDIVTVTYTKSAGNPLQTPSGGQGVTLTAQSVINNCLDLTKPNNPPTLVIKNKTSSYSGFVDNIDASDTYDLNNDILTYEWTVPNNIPVSSISGSEIRFLAPEVNTPQDFDFKLKVNDGKTIASKNIPINILPYKPELDEARITDIDASGYQAPDYPNNVVDGNLSTKWAADGENQWLFLKMAAPFKISHLQMAFLPEQRYESYFDVYASMDNLIWEHIFTKGASCNFSGDIQVFDFPSTKTNTEYSYIKVVGHGNSLNTWNNISEFKIFGFLSQNQVSGEYEKRNIVIYPNPAHDFFNVSIEETTLKPQKIRIVDFTGKIVYEDYMSSGIKKVPVPSNFNSGWYIVELFSGSLILFAEKLIIIL